MGLEGSAFFRTNRILAHQPFRWWVVISLVGVLGWATWFFFAPLPLTIISQDATFTSARSIMAQFPPDEALKFVTNQPAEIRVDQFPWRDHGSGRGLIINANHQIQNDLIEVEIQLTQGLETIPLQRGLTAQVLIISEEKTPAELLWQRLVLMTDNR